MTDWSDADRTWLTEHGVSVEDATAQLQRLRGPRPCAVLDRPAVRGDGIDVLSTADWPALEWAHAEATATGRLSAFVPASGAATRLCRDLVSAWQGDMPSVAARTVLDHAPRLALWPDLQARGAEAGEDRAILAAMFGDGGLDLSSWPKALVPFHRDGAAVRLPLEEHLVECGRLVRAGDGPIRLHLTVSAEHQDRMTEVTEDLSARWAARVGRAVEWSFSTQDPSTDTVAVEPEGAVFRTDDGRPLLRPGGHGALLGNLQALADGGADVVVVKNIDNVVPQAQRGAVLPWRRRVAGLLVLRQAEAWAHLAALRDGQDGAVQAAAAWVSDVLGLDLPHDAEALADRLDRPWRVCGMVRLAGQPGGGPFWVRGPDGSVSLQIVEGIQIDGDDPGQAAILAGSTHFNPVEMALGLKTSTGAPHDLARFVDDGAWMVTSKSHSGRPLKALERPGLWNGTMAGWNTVFVEIPDATFQPVKTLADLLKAAHGGPL